MRLARLTARIMQMYAVPQKAACEDAMRIYNAKAAKRSRKSRKFKVYKRDWMRKYREDKRRDGNKVAGR